MRCCDCKEDLDITAFTKNASSKTGYNRICKACKKVRDVKHRERHKDRLQEASKVYYAENRETIIARYKEYAKNNPEKVHASVHDWYNRNKDVNTESWHIHRAKTFYQELGYPIDTPLDRINPKVLFARDKGVCGICKLEVQDTEQSMDHIISLSKGGLHIWSNVQLAHLECNKRKQ